jgi:hypothetical protein
MKINVENFQKLVRIEYPEKEKKIVTIVTEEHLDENGKIVNKSIKRTESPREESIDSIKYELLNKMIDIVMFPQVDFIDKDESDTWKKGDEKNEDEISSYEIAYNTLIRYKILEN